MRDLLNDIRTVYPTFAEAPGQSVDEPLIAETFARFVVAKFESGERAEIRPAFQIIEGWLASENAVVREAGFWFIETLQNIASHRAFGADVFRTYLAARSREAWDQIDSLWQGKERLADVVAAERGTSIHTIHKSWWRWWKRKSPKKLLAKVSNPALRTIIEQITRNPNDRA